MFTLPSFVGRLRADRGAPQAPPGPEPDPPPGRARTLSLGRRRELPPIQEAAAAPRREGGLPRPGKLAPIAAPDPQAQPGALPAAAPLHSQRGRTSSGPAPLLAPISLSSLSKSASPSPKAGSPSADSGENTGQGRPAPGARPGPPRQPASLSSPRPLRNSAPAAPGDPAGFPPGPPGEPPGDVSSLGLGPLREGFGSQAFNSSFEMLNSTPRITSQDRANSPQRVPAPKVGPFRRRFPSRLEPPRSERPGAPGGHSPREQDPRAPVLVPAEPPKLGRFLYLGGEESSEIPAGSYEFSDEEPAPRSLSPLRRAH